MIWQRHSLLLILITACLLLQGGCASRSKDPGPLAYPFFKPAGDNAKELTCVQLDRTLRRVDAVRWSMRLDGKKAYTQLEKVGQSIVMAGMSALLFPLDPFHSTLYGVSSVANPFVDDPVSAADARIIGLLRIKRDKNCAATRSGHAGKTDLDVLAALVLLGGQCLDDLREESDCIERRTEWMDRLYLEQPLAEMANPTG